MDDYFCPRCGKEVDDGQKTCPYCDAVVQERPEEHPIPETPLTTKSKYYPFIILIVLGLLIVAALILKK